MAWMPCSETVLTWRSGSAGPASISNRRPRTSSRPSAGGAVDGPGPEGPGHAVLALQKEAPDRGRHVFALEIAVRPLDRLGAHDEPRVYPLGKSQRVGKVPRLPDLPEDLEIALCER